MGESNRVPDRKPKKSQTINEIIQSAKTGHGLDTFDPEEITELQKTIFYKRGRPYVKCFVSGVDRSLKPEEIVRQLFTRRLVNHYHYPLKQLAVEKGVYFGSAVHEKRADIVVFHKDTDEPRIIVEVKKPNRRDGEEQLKSYCNAEGSPIGVWTNGNQLEVWYKEEPNNFISISNIPTVDQTLEQVISEPWTIDKLEKENKLVTEKKSLRDIILTLEDLVLANSGVDSFDEVFKLIYAKLYDESAAKNIKSRKRMIQFRNYGESTKELHNKISGLFDNAKEKWRGVFGELEKIELTPSHLETCVTFLQDIKLFNSNLYVIDEAFEYLVIQIAKGSKGQYFTPRYVIDMCVRMLNPKENEYVLDPAAGSCGFTVHTIFHIANHQFTSQKLPEHAYEFAQNNVYGIDFDGRAVKVAKALNLIAGDGKTHVYKANSLDPASWNEETKAAMKLHLKHFPKDPKLEEENLKSYKYLNFNIVFSNPPFAGPIGERHILRQYRLREKNGKPQSKVERDVLFLERCINCLGDGGRMAIVLPQGIFSNPTDEYIRKFITEKGRILAVVGLDEYTFKPHSSTKTSVLFFQKWHEKLCPKVDDYPIFFGISKKTGKDSTGSYLFLRNEKNEIILDEAYHPLIEHDLDEIEKEFKNFAKKEKLSFWRD